MKRLLDNTHLYETLKNTLYTIILRGVGVLIGVAFTAILARNLGLHDTGVFFVFINMIMLLSIVSRMGFDQNIVKNIAIGINTQTRNPNEVLYPSLIYAIVPGVIIAIITYANSDSLSQIFFKNEAYTFIFSLVAIGVPAFSFIMLISEGFRGIGAIRSSQFVNGVSLNLMMLLALILLGDYELNFVAKTYIVLCWLVPLITIAAWQSRVHKKSDVSNWISFPEMFNQSKHLWTASVLDTINIWGGVIFLTILSTEEDAGLFGAANRLMAIIIAALYALNIAVGPRLAVLFSKGDIDKIKKLSKQITVILVLTSSCILLVVLFYSEKIMSLFGKEFIPGANVLIILSIAHFINSSAGIIDNLLIMGNKQKLQRNAVLSGTIIFVACSVLLIPYIGASGAAYAFLVSIIVRKALGMIYLYRSFGFTTFPTLRSNR